MAPAIVAAIIGAGATLAQTGASLYSQSKSADEARKAANEKAKRIQNAITKAEGIYGDTSNYGSMMDILEEFRKGQDKFASPEMKKDYQDLIQGYNPSDYVYNFGKFSDQYDKSIDDFLDPYTEKILAATKEGILRQGTGSGSAWDADMVSALAQGEMEKMNELRSEARQEYMQDRQQNYQEYSDYISNMQKKYDTLSNLTANKISLLGGAISHDETQDSSYYSDLLSILGDKAQLGVNAQLYS